MQSQHEKYKRVDELHIKGDQFKLMNDVDQFNRVGEIEVNELVGLCERIKVDCLASCVFGAEPCNLNRSDGIEVLKAASQQ